MTAPMPSTVLLIDDEPDVLYYFSQVIKRCFPTYKTHSCQTSADALEYLSHETTCCVITDYRLAHGDTTFLIHTIQERWPEIPVVLITGLEPSLVIPEAAHCAAVLSKPITLHELRATLRSVLESIEAYSGATV